jgi:hypothetical protein
LAEIEKSVKIQIFFCNIVPPDLSDFPAQTALKKYAAARPPRIF